MSQLFLFLSLSLKSSVQWVEIKPRVTVLSLLMFFHKDLKTVNLQIQHHEEILCLKFHLVFAMSRIRGPRRNTCQNIHPFPDNLTRTWLCWNRQPPPPVCTTVGSAVKSLAETEQVEVMQPLIHQGDSMTLVSMPRRPVNQTNHVFFIRRQTWTEGGGPFNQSQQEPLNVSFFRRSHTVSSYRDKPGLNDRV